MQPENELEAGRLYWRGKGAIEKTRFTSTYCQVKELGSVWFFQDRLKRLVKAWYVDKRKNSFIKEAVFLK
jgi:hypothetical protein